MYVEKAAYERNGQGKAEGTQGRDRQGLGEMGETLRRGRDRKGSGERDERNELLIVDRGG